MTNKEQVIKELKEEQEKFSYFREVSFSDMKNDLMNHIACWCMRHCAVNEGTVRTLLHKVYLKNVEGMIQEIREERGR